MVNLKKSFILISSLSLLSACSGFFSTSEEVPSRLAEAQKRRIENTTTDIRIESDLPGSRASVGAQEPEDVEYGVEVTWDVPEESVDGYIIYSGTEENVFDSEIHVKLAELQTLLPNKYSYIIAPVNPEKPLYVAIAAKKGESVSPKSEAQELRPKARFGEH
jgi:hypothetical protein